MLEKLTFGGRTPWAIGLLLVLTVVPSIALALFQHVGPIGFEEVALVEAAVERGQAWRLVTWLLFQPGPLALLFMGLLLWWFGADLANAVGSRRFLWVYFGIGIATGLVTCVIAKTLAPELTRIPYFGSWALSPALTIMWGYTFPDRTMRLYFVLPVRGAWLPALTVGLTVLFTIYYGWRLMVPEIAAEALTFAWMFRRRFTKPVERSVAKQQKRRAAARHLRLVESHDDEPPPLPKDVEKQLGDLFDPTKKR